MTGPVGLGQEEIPALYARASRSVVLLKTFDRMGTETGQGTGFIVPGGWAVTNHHVVDGASRIEVVTVDKVAVPAKELLVDDERNDLAVLRLAEHVLVPLELRDGAPTIGERVMVVGNPLGLSGTLSEGIVSGVWRRGLEDEIDPKFKGVPLLQTNAPISPGSSGSPVIDSKGRVLGVATFTFSHGQNLNFAIPAWTLRGLLRRIDPAHPVRQFRREGPTLAENLLISSAVVFILGLLLWRLTRKRTEPDVLPKEGPFARR